jgi:hypothetical protein
VLPPMTGTNCFGRSSPVMLRVIDCKRVPSPPARMTAQRSLRRKWLVALPTESFCENRCWDEIALMNIGFPCLGFGEQS